MTYFRLHAFWKSRVTNLKIGFIRRSVDEAGPSIGPDFFPYLRSDPELAGVNLHLKNRTPPKLVLNTQNCKRRDHRGSIKTRLHHGDNAIGPAFERSNAGLACSQVCEILGVLLNVSRLGFSDDRLWAVFCLLLACLFCVPIWQV
jgi:hypothetical protein